MHKLWRFVWKGCKSMKEWRCFHCDEVFTDKQKAKEHFGDMGFKEGKVTWDKTTCEELAEVKRLCGDRYPDAMALNTIHQLRAEIKRWKECVAQGDSESDQLRAEAERLKAVDESAGQAAFELQCQTMNERDQWRAVARELAERITAVLQNSHWDVSYGSGDLRITLARFAAMEKGTP